MVFVTRPFCQTIFHVYRPGAVKDVALGLKVVWHLALNKFESGRVAQHRVSAFIKHRRPAVIAGNLAWHIVDGGRLRSAEEVDTMAGSGAFAFRHADRSLGKYDRVLERRAMETLAVATVTKLRIPGIACKLELQVATPARRLVLWSKLVARPSERRLVEKIFFVITAVFRGCLALPARVWYRLHSRLRWPLNFLRRLLLIFGPFPYHRNGGPVAGIDSGRPRD